MIGHSITCEVFTEVKKDVVVWTKWRYVKGVPWLSTKERYRKDVPLLHKWYIKGSGFGPQRRASHVSQVKDLLRAPWAVFTFEFCLDPCTSQINSCWFVDYDSTRSQIYLLLPPDAATHSVAQRTGFIFALFPGKQGQAQGKRGAQDSRDEGKARPPDHFPRVTVRYKFYCIYLLEVDFPFDLTLLLPGFASHSLVPAIETTQVDTHSR